jgi:molybdenum-dependent DNA-binding transcriptional regulator ModE
METISMSRKERKRLEAFARVQRGEITLVKASELLELSYRQVKRCFTRYQKEGDRGLVHRLRGRASNRQTNTRRKRRVLAVYEKKYADYGPTLAVECLKEEESIEVAVETLRQWLLAAGLWRKCRRRRPYRQRRARKEYFGELVQMDGSHHDWFEGRRDWAVLMVLIDDATSEVFAWFSEGETTIAAMEAFSGYVKHYGLPRALYVDRDSIYRCEREATIAENLAGKEPTTQFGRAMEELDVRIIMAHSPQAKGRVERVNGTLQDRLVKALRRAKISDLASANRFLQEKFLPAFNRRFGKKAAKAGDLHRRLPRGLDLGHVLSIRETRVVQNDWTLRFENRWFQLAQPHQKLALAGRAVTVSQRLDGRVELLYGGRELSYRELPAPPQQRQEAIALEIRSNQGQRPPADHPWRQGLPGGHRRRGRAGLASLRLATLASATPAPP